MRRSYPLTTKAASCAGKDPTDGDKMLSPDVDFQFRRLDIAKPVGARSEAAHDNQFRAVGTVFQHFQDGFALRSGAVSDMGQQQMAE